MIPPPARGIKNLKKFIPEPRTPEPKDAAIDRELQKETAWPSDKGAMKIMSFCRPSQIRTLRFDREFGRHAQYKSLYTRKESLEAISAQPGANVVLAVAGEDHIIGFGVLAFPPVSERWAELGPGVMMEVKAVEVCRSWRSSKVAHGIVGSLLDFPQIEDRIAYMVGYSWTWDLDGTGMTGSDYRRMLIRLFEPFGFQEFQTNEPNLCLKPENLFMGRIGANVSEKTQKDFKWLRFGISPS